MYLGLNSIKISCRSESSNISLVVLDWSRQPSVTGWHHQNLLFVERKDVGTGLQTTVLTGTV